ncbi:hypothetical protein [Fimbriiglobus ruber]|uniref:hypothetical protein n=1 Tax=Fimbriiglobus ruber TaxID=1908690 RepID=UPI001EE6A0DE|nr:hypothetical protein [Fimbriiglobus ruber]
MTESEWLYSPDPTPMLEFLRGKVSDRKLRLFACAVTRHHAQNFKGSERLLKGLEIGERFADNSKSKTAAKRLQEAFHEQYYPGDGPLFWLSWMYQAAMSKNTFRIFWSFLTRDGLVREALITAELAAMAAQVARDVFNPFRPATLNPAWQTPTVLSLAQGIYTDRAFDRLPILADALEEASCDNPDLLNHCRSETVHTRGCWALDLLLGRI